MNCIERILCRRSIRRFRPESVSEEVMTRILHAGRLAPTATNQQPWHFCVLSDEVAKEACTFQGFNRFATQAPTIILGLYLASEAMMEKYSLMDVTTALQNMVLAAWVQGIGSCWMGAFDEKKLRATLGLPADARIVGAIAVGVPDEEPKQPAKRTLSDIVHVNRW